MPTAFDFASGLSQGRVTDDNAPEGSYIFELGHAGGQTAANIAVGDYSEVSQVISVVSNDLLARVTIVVTEPSETSSFIAWEIVGILDTVVFYRRRLPSNNRTYVLSDIAISLISGGAPSTLAFKLEAVTP